MRDMFIIAPYGVQAAVHFASLWQDRQERNIVKDLQDTEKATRAELRADCMIVATALAQKASCIYSHDRKLKTFAGSALPIIELPREQTQFDLFPNKPGTC